MPLFRRNKTAPDPSTAERGAVTIDGVTYPLNDYQTGVYPSSSHSANRPTIRGAESVMAHATAHDVVAAAIEARQLVVQQAWFRFQDVRTHRVVGGRDLALFEDRRQIVPVLGRAEWHASTTGQAYFYRTGDAVRLLRPDYVDVVLDVDATPGEIDEATQGGRVPIGDALDAEVIGYVHKAPGRPADVITADSVAHWKPTPHPLTPWLGASWVSSIIKRMAGDEQADIAADKFFEHGSTPALVYVLDKSKTPEEAAKFKAVNEAQTAGVLNSSRNVYLGGGTDVKVVGTALKELGLKEWRGQLETRIAMRSRVPAIILGISEGMQGSALNSGNYGQTRRQWADGFITPHLDSLAAALDGIVSGPTRGGVGSYLSWDPAKIQIMQEDRTDEAEIASKNASTISAYVSAGYEPMSAVEAVTNNDPTMLKHSGLVSVQLLPPGTTGDNP